MDKNRTCTKRYEEAVVIIYTPYPLENRKVVWKILILYAHTHTSAQRSLYLLDIIASLSRHTERLFLFYFIASRYQSIASYRARLFFLVLMVGPRRNEGDLYIRKMETVDALLILDPIYIMTSRCENKKLVIRNELSLDSWIRVPSLSFHHPVNCLTSCEESPPSIPSNETSGASSFV